MIGCATSNQVHRQSTELKNYLSIQVYGVNSSYSPEDVKFISKISVSSPENKGSFSNPNYGVKFSPLDYSNPIGEKIRKKALMLGANSVINAKMQVTEQIVQDDFGERSQRVVEASGDAVFDPRLKVEFISPRFVDFFCRKILRIPKMEGRDDQVYLTSWTFFRFENGDILCDRGKIIGEPIRDWYIYSKEHNRKFKIGTDFSKSKYVKVLIPANDLASYAP